MKFPEQYQWLLNQKNQYPGFTQDYQPKWDAFRFHVGGKMFAFLGENKEKQTILTLKGSPELNEQYRTMYASVLAGYYMNKAHWISIVLNEARDVTDDFIYERLAQSYALVAAKLPKKIRDTLK